MKNIQEKVAVVVTGGCPMGQIDALQAAREGVRNAIIERLNR